MGPGQSSVDSPMLQHKVLPHTSSISSEACITNSPAPHMAASSPFAAHPSLSTPEVGTIATTTSTPPKDVSNGEEIC